MSRNKEHRGTAFGGAPNGAAAFGGRPIGSVFFVSAHSFFYVMNIYGYSLYIPYIFHTHIQTKISFSWALDPMDNLVPLLREVIKQH